MLVESPLGNLLDGSIASPKELDWLDLSWSEADQRAMKKRTRAGTEVRILLRLGLRLRHGDLITDGIAINVLPCDLLVAYPRTSSEWAKASFELGNLHVPIQVLPDRLITLADGPTEAILCRLGILFNQHHDRFEPTCRPDVTIVMAPDFSINMKS